MIIGDYLDLFQILPLFMFSFIAGWFADSSDPGWDPTSTIVKPLVFQGIKRTS